MKKLPLIILPLLSACIANPPITSQPPERGVEKETVPDIRQARYTDNYDGTITDNRSGLIWLKNANCFDRQTWETAMQSAANISSGQCGLRDGSWSGDWRLPTRDEWKAMIDKRYNKPSLSNAAGTDQWTEGDPFTGVPSGYYWSSSRYAGSLIVTWVVGLGFGDAHVGGKVSTVYVWPVRGGQ